MDRAEQRHAVAADATAPNSSGWSRNAAGSLMLSPTSASITATSMATRFTLDTNCLLSLEEERPEAASVRALLARHTARTAVVSIPATTAAERQKDGQFLPDFSLFTQRLADAGLGHLPLLKPIAVFDMSYLDWCVLADGEDDVLVRAIHAVLFSSPYDHAEAVETVLEGEERNKAFLKWRNRRLDALGLHTHIRSRGDVFVTSDANFAKATKGPALAELGAGVILAPAAAEAYAASR